MITSRVHKSFAHVWLLDPALDKSDETAFSEAWSKFIKGEIQATDLPVKEGQRVTIFRCHSLKRAHMLALSDTAVTELRSLIRGASDGGIVGLAFLRVFDEVVSRGLNSAENFFDGQGNPISLTLIDDGQGGKRLSKQTLEELNHVRLINELGLRILEASMPDPTSGQA